MTTPVIAIKSTTARAENILILLAAITLENISLPYISVPMICAKEGACLDIIRFCSDTLYGVRYGEKNANIKSRATRIEGIRIFLFLIFTSKS